MSPNKFYLLTRPAVHSRKKKREWIDGLDARYNEKTEECERLQQRVRRLEAEYAFSVTWEPVR